MNIPREHPNPEHVDISRQIEQELHLEAMHKRAEALLRFPRLLEELGEKGFMQKARELAEDLTGSAVSFIHFVNEDEGTIQLAAYDKHDPIEKAGIWADALRQKKPVTVNEYETYTDKQGLSEGHALLKRFISVPVFEQGKVVMLAGVGNKAVNYTDLDVETVRIFANEIWALVQRRRGQKNLRASEERLRSLSEQVPGVVYEFQMFADGRYAFPYVSSHARESLGLEPEEIRSDPDAFMRYVHPEDVESLWRANEESRETLQTWNCEFRYQHPVKGLIWLWGAANPSPQPDGAVLWHGYITDITGRKQAEGELRRLSTAIEQSTETVVITDTRGTIQYVNPAFETVTGYTREEALGQNPRVLRSGEHDEAFYHAMWNTVMEGNTWEGRIVNKRKDGSLFTEEATISPVKDEKGTIINYVAIKRDITDELKREEMLLQSQKMETVGRLASGVAHDFNNLLTGIMGLTELCKLSLPGDHEVQLNLDHILEAVNRSTGITRQLLAFARKQTISPRVVDLNQAISNTLNLLRGLIGENIHLHFEPGVDLPSVFIDPGQIDQILTNLCVNAKDAIENVGEITLKTFRYSPGDGDGLPRVCLQVQDTGCGMDAETLDNIFEPFFTTKATGRGTGLGLATVYGIVTQNRGSIDVRSTPGQGTQFRIFFPGVPADDAEEITESARVLPAGNATILFVDDEKLICESVKFGLEKIGYHLETASSPEEALRLVEEKGTRFDLLISDVVMPGMNGRDLADRLTEKCPDLRLLFISGYNADIISHQGILDKGLHFLAKPFTLKDLARKVNEILNGG